MYKFISSLTLVVSIVLLLSFCSSPNENEIVDDYRNSFTPEFVGMEKQFYIYAENYYNTNIITKTAVREDGQEVFVHEISRSDDPSLDISTNRYIKEGFLYSTTLTANDNKEDPFHEIRIAKSYPNEGDSWWVSDSAPDSLNLLTTVVLIGELKTPAGTFKNVISNRSYDNYYQSYVDIYYAKGFGFIGSVIGTDSMLVNYIKIENKVFGEKF